MGRRDRPPTTHAERRAHSPGTVQQFTPSSTQRPQPIELRPNLAERTDELVDLHIAVLVHAQRNAHECLIMQLLCLRTDALAVVNVTPTHWRSPRETLAAIRDLALIHGHAMQVLVARSNTRHTFRLKRFLDHRARHT